MNNPIISLDTPEEREKSIKLMVSSLRFEAEADEGSLDARSAAMLIELMPVFIRFLDRERKAFFEGIKHDHRERQRRPAGGVLADDDAAAGQHAGRCPHDHRAAEPGRVGVERKGDMRLMLLRNVMENLFNGVVGYFNCAEDQLAEANGGHGKLHS